MTRRYPNIRRRRPSTSGMTHAQKLAEAGRVDVARKLVAATPPGVVVIEVNLTRTKAR